MKKLQSGGRGCIINPIVRDAGLREVQRDPHRSVGNGSHYYL